MHYLSAVLHFLNFHKHFIFSATQDTRACFMDANSDAIARKEQEKTELF